MTLKEFFDRVSMRALGYRESLEATYEIARMCIRYGIPGDFVECGVFAGGHVAAMARAFMDEHVFGVDMARRIHLFDSFEGMPAADPRDEEIWKHHGAKTGESACSLGSVTLNMREWEIDERLLVYHPGWFDGTVPEWARIATTLRIALLRLDCDLYSSTKVCIDELYPLVSRGGWVIGDDWNLSGFREAIQTKVVPAPIYWRIPTK